jgi:hypothetical protein
MSHAQGRFLAVDPENAGARIKDPQSWNAYIYSRNNPLKYLDPDGTTYRVWNDFGFLADFEDEDFYSMYYLNSDYRFINGSNMLYGVSEHPKAATTEHLKTGHKR